MVAASRSPARRGATARSALTSRNSLLPLRRAIAARNPDLITPTAAAPTRSSCAAGAIAEHRERELTRRPERRVMHGVALRDGGWVVEPARLDAPAASSAAPTCCLAAATALELGRRRRRSCSAATSTRRSPAMPGLTHVAGHHVDHVFVAGRAATGRARGARRRPAVGPRAAARDARLGRGGAERVDHRGERRAGEAAAAGGDVDPPPRRSRRRPGARPRRAPNASSASSRDHRDAEARRDERGEHAELVRVERDVAARSRPRRTRGRRSRGRRCRAAWRPSARPRSAASATASRVGGMARRERRAAAGPPSGRRARAGRRAAPARAMSSCAHDSVDVAEPERGQRGLRLQLGGPHAHRRVPLPPAPRSRARAARARRSGRRRRGRRRRRRPPPPTAPRVAASSSARIASVRATRRAARLGQPHPAAMAVEQRDAGLALERGELLRDRRRRERRARARRRRSCRARATSRSTRMRRTSSVRSVDVGHRKHSLRPCRSNRHLRCRSTGATLHRMPARPAAALATTDRALGRPRSRRSAPRWSTSAPAT